MTELSALAPKDLQHLRTDLMQRYKAICDRKVSLDITRGKPSPEQLDLSNGLLEMVSSHDFHSAAGVDCRNYGGLDGLPEARTLFAAYMDVAPEEIIIGGNSSLNLMYDTFLRAMQHGVGGDAPPWSRQPAVKFICPSPGYDRHFAICEQLGIEMLPVAMTADGPDMDAVESLAAQDASVKGIWCVPVYSNPTGAVYPEHDLREVNRICRELPARVRLRLHEVADVRPVEGADENCRVVERQALDDLLAPLVPDFDVLQLLEPQRGERVVCPGSGPPSSMCQ